MAFQFYIAASQLLTEVQQKHAMKMKEAGCSKSFVTAYKAIYCPNPEQQNEISLLVLWLLLYGLRSQNLPAQVSELHRC
jgi:hypothetical protein